MRRSCIAAFLLLLGLSISPGVVSCTDEEAGIEGSPCYPNKTCNDGLTCLSGYCVRVPVPDGLGTDGPAGDIMRVDKNYSDTRTADISLIDASQPDGPVADAGVQDQTQPDASSSIDLKIIDAPVSDTKVPLPDAPQPDAKPPKPDLLQADTKLIKPDAPLPDTNPPKPDAPLPDIMQPDAPLLVDASPPKIKPSNGISCGMYNKASVQFNPKSGSYIFNTVDGSIYRTDTSTYIRPKGYANSAYNGMYFGISSQSGVSDIGVFVFSAIDVPVSVSIRARGQNAFALLAPGKISIKGKINATGGLTACGSVSSEACPGPGGNPGGSGAISGDGFPLGKGGGIKGSGNSPWIGAGGGGSFGGSGGAGGPTGFGGKGGKLPTLSSGLLEGGRGGASGASAAGGGGGGAVQITSNTTIEIIGGGINVGGGGGAVSKASKSYGGGGGSGGAIFLEAPTVVLKSTSWPNAVLGANGGGGGSSSSGGKDGDLACTPTAGGTPICCDPKAAGGKGGAGTVINGENAGPFYSFAEYGGGGGGGTGLIHINTQSGKGNLGSGCVVSPDPSTTVFTQGKNVKCP